MVYFNREVKVLLYTEFLAVLLNFRDGSLDVAIVPLVDFQCLFLGALGCVGPIALGRFLHTIDIGVLAAADPHFLKVAATVMVVEGVDGEDLLLLYLRQAEDGTDVIVPVLELALVEENFHITVVDDGFLDNR